MAEPSRETQKTSGNLNVGVLCAKGQHKFKNGMAEPRKVKIKTWDG
jgi:hypothetical protein